MRVPRDRNTPPELARARLCLRFAMVALAASAALLGLSLARAGGADAPPAAPVARQLPPLRDDRSDVQPLLAKVSGRTLLRPAQVQAAVKSDGVAEQMVKQLKLQGVIDLAGKPTAYVMVEKQGVKTLRQGDKVLELTVEKIEPGRVTFSYQGVVVTLGNG